jgi:hypothetical protein
MAMTALKIGAPRDYIQLLEEHADLVNLPRVGVDENVAFPAVQANVAPAVALEDAQGILKFDQSYICLLFFQIRVLNLLWASLGRRRGTLMKVMMKLA